MPRGYNKKWLAQARREAVDKYLWHAGKKLRSRLNIRRRNKVRGWDDEPRPPKDGRHVIIFTAAQPVDYMGVTVGYDQYICYRAYAKGRLVSCDNVLVKKVSRAGGHRYKMRGRKQAKLAFKKAVRRALLSGRAVLA